VHVVADAAAAGADAPLQRYHCDGVSDDTQPRPGRGDDAPQPLERDHDISQPVLAVHKTDDRHSLSLTRAATLLVLLKTIYS
jgi:hypothetical protein